MDKVTIIIPVYNIENTIAIFKKTIKSVIRQSYNNLEVLIINDGSTDETKILLSSIVKKDSRIRVITKKNGGVESARRRGITEAKGEYVFHLDQDDLLERNAIKTLYEEAKKYDADVCIGQSKHFYGLKILGKKNEFEVIKVLGHEEFMSKYYHGFFGVCIFPVQIWNKLYKKSFLNICPNPPCMGMYHEDLSYNMHVLPYANRIVWIPQITHYYRWGGFTTKPIKNMDKVALSCYRIKMDKIEELGLKNFRYSTSVELLNYMNSYFYQVAVYNRADLKDEIEKKMNLPELIEAVEMVKSGEYTNPHINLMISQNYTDLVQYEFEMVKKNKWKAILKMVLNTN